MQLYFSDLHLFWGQSPGDSPLGTVPRGLSPNTRRAKQAGLYALSMELDKVISHCNKQLTTRLRTPDKAKPVCNRGVKCVSEMACDKESEAGRALRPVDGARQSHKSLQQAVDDSIANRLSIK